MHINLNTVSHNNHTLQILKHAFSFLGLPCVFALLPDRKKSTYEQLFQELKDIAISMNQEWKPERIITDYETSLIPAILTEVINYH